MRGMSRSSVTPPQRGFGAPGPPAGRGNGNAYRAVPRSSGTGRVEPRIAARDLGRKGPITPFAHLARTQLWSVAGDALITSSLATTVFFNNDPNAPREKVALYLLLTLAPFAVASPFLGPLIDRVAGGRRWFIIGSAVARALVAFLLIGDLENPRFYLWAFMMLVLSKVHLISKSALLPTTVRNDEELVEANSKLALLGAGAAIAAGPGFALSKTVGAQWTIGLAMIAFVVTAAQAYGLPVPREADQPAGAAERDELQGAGIIRASEAMATLRFAVGFLTFAILFAFRSAGVPNSWYLIAAVAAQTGLLLGSAIAPALRRLLVEERMVMIGLALAFVASAAAAIPDGLGAACLLAFAVGCGGTVAKQGFDSLVQRDAPDANRGRSFARFESRFQMVWVIGAFIPVVLPIPQRLAFAVIAVVSLFAVCSYAWGYRQIKAAAAGLRPAIPMRVPISHRLYRLVRPDVTQRAYEAAQISQGSAPTPVSAGPDPFSETSVDVSTSTLAAPMMPAPPPGSAPELGNAHGWAAEPTTSTETERGSLPGSALVTLPGTLSPITGFLIDDVDPFAGRRTIEGHSTVDLSFAGPIGQPDANGLPPEGLAPSNPLVSGRWRSPQPEELFGPEEAALPMPPPEVTPTGIFAPVVPFSPGARQAPPAVPVVAYPSTDALTPELLDDLVPDDSDSFDDSEPLVQTPLPFDSPVMPPAADAGWDSAEPRWRTP